MSEKTRAGSSTNIGGKSGSFFFFTDDKQFIVKTIPYSELKTLESLAQDMTQHYDEQNQNGHQSLLAVCQGLYKFKLDKQPAIYLMLMKNSIQKQY